MKPRRIAATTGLAVLFWAVTAQADEMPGDPPESIARSFPAENGIVDLMVTGPAAQALYDRLPGRGQKQACGATGLHKGDGPMRCVKQDDGSYTCHIWFDTPRQSLTQPESDDC